MKVAAWARGLLRSFASSASESLATGLFALAAMFRAGDGVVLIGKALHPLRSDVAGNLPRPVAGHGPDRAGGSDRDQRVRRRPVAQNPPSAVADDFISSIVKKSDAVR